MGEAGDGQEAVELADKLRPDCILMDISMPKLDGIEATRIIHQRHPGVKIIGLSLYSEDERAVEMINAGAALYLCKAGPPAKLIAAIRACANRCDEQQAMRIVA